jgi:hypothetical protein
MHRLAHFPPAARRDLAGLAFRIDHDDRAFIGQQVRDQRAPALAGAGGRNGDHVALAFQPERISRLHHSRRPITEADLLARFINLPAEQQPVPCTERRIIRRRKDYGIIW